MWFHRLDHVQSATGFSLILPAGEFGAVSAYIDRHVQPLLSNMWHVVECFSNKLGWKACTVRFICRLISDYYNFSLGIQFAQLVLYSTTQSVSCRIVATSTLCSVIIEGV